MKVLQVLFTLGKSDGSANVIMNLYRQIDSSKIQFDFLYFVESENSFIKEIQTLGGYSYKIKFESVCDLLNIKKNINLFFETINTRYDAVHVNFPLLGCFVFKLSHAHGINNLILHSHSSGYGTTFLKKIRNRILYSLAVRKANIYLACSKPAGIFLFGRKNYELGKVKLVNNAIDCIKYDWNVSIREKVRSTLGISDEFIIGHVGRFSKEKNHVFIIEVFKEIKKSYPKSKLILVGDGPEFKNVCTRAAAYNLDNDILFLGLRSDINELLQAFDVFVMPSLIEGLPVTLVEAQAAGLPCVVSENIPKDSCIVPDLYKSLSLDTSEKIWAKEIIKFIDFKRFSTYNMMKQKKFDINEVCRDLESWYKSL